MTDIDTSYEPGDTPKVTALKHAISELRHKLSIAEHSAAPDVFSYREQFRPISELQAVADNTPSPERLVLRGYSTVKRDPATGKMHIVSKAGNNVEEGIAYRYFLEAGFIKRHDWPTVVHDLLKRAAIEMAKYYTEK